MILRVWLAPTIGAWVWQLNLRSSVTTTPKPLSEVLLEIRCLSLQFDNIKYYHHGLFFPKWKTFNFLMLNSSLCILAHLQKQSRLEIIEATPCCLSKGPMIFDHQHVGLVYLSCFLENFNVHIEECRSQNSSLWHPT